MKRLWLALALLASSTAMAQSARSGGGSSASADAAMRQVQQLASERTALQAENAKLKKDLEEMRKERDALKSGSQSASARLAAAQATTQSALARSSREKESAENELTQLKAKMQELIAKFRETVETLKEVESSRNMAREGLVSGYQQLQSCAARNSELYKLTDEVLTHFDRQSPMSCVTRAEPFTRIERTRLENLIDSYRERAEDNTFELGPAPKGATGEK